MSGFDERIRAKFANVVRTMSDLHSYQSNEAIPFLRKNPFSALFIDMGMGKSISVATVACELLGDFLTEKVLIIGPLKVATDTWPTELGLWLHTAPFNFTVVREDDDDPRLAIARRRGREHGEAIAREWGGSAEDIAKQQSYYAGRFETAERIVIRGEKAVDRASIHIINREQVEWLVNFHKGAWPYRTVIIDESSGFKDHKSGRFIALAKIRAILGLITRLHLLTATPAAESYEHLWAQIYLLDRGKRLGKDITSYRNRYFVYNKYSMKLTLRPDGEEDVLAKIADICLVMKAKDYLKLDEPTIAPRRVILSPNQMALYERMRTESIVDLPDGSEIEAETAAALSAKLLQMASGVLYETYKLEDVETNDMTKVRRIHHLHDHKIDALKEIIEEAQGQTLLVAYHHKASLDRLKKAFPNAVVMDRVGKCIKDWNAGKIPMLLIHPQSGGHGLNLQAGGHNIVFFDLPWSLELYLQLIGRLARQGQKYPVVVQLLIAVGTLDETVFAALCEKGASQDKLFAILQRLIRLHKRLNREQTVRNSIP